jgi:hypothetical protein
VPSVQVRRKKIPINCYDYYNFNFYSSPSKWSHTCIVRRWVTSVSLCRS